MRRQIGTLALTLAVAAGAALAHEGVKDPDVKARMELMGDIREAMKTLGGMAQGKIAFDAEAAAEAKAALAAHSAEIPEAFEAKAMDPKSEAKPVLWEEFDAFTGHADDLEAAASALETGSLDALRGDIREVGQACSGCHEDYRIDKD